MQDKKELSIVFPLFNEEENVRPVVLPVAEALRSNNIDYELVLVDNGSYDSTGKILDELSSENSRIKKIRVERNQGYGHGVICGLNACSGAFVGFMCGDGQVKPEVVVDVYNKLINDNLDLAKAARVERKDGLKRRVISGIYNSLFILFFNVGTKDVNGTPKIFKRELLKKFEPFFKDYFIDAGIMIKAKEYDLRIGEVPVLFLAREKGESNINFAALIEFLKNIIYSKFLK